MVVGNGGRTGPLGSEARSTEGLGRMAAPTTVFTVFAESQAAAKSSATLAVQAYFLKKRSSMERHHPRLGNSNRCATSPDRKPGKDTGDRGGIPSGRRRPRRGRSRPCQNGKTRRPGP